MTSALPQGNDLDRTGPVDPDSGVKIVNGKEPLWGI